MDLYKTTKERALLKIQNWMLCSAIRLSHKILKLAYQAASFLECCLLVDNALDCLGKQIEEQITVARLKENSDRILSESNSVQPNEQRDEDLLSAARLKKKEVQPKSSKRHRSWLEKTHKFKKKVPNKSTVCL